MDDDALLERCARAAYAVDQTVTRWVVTSKENQDYWRAVARAVLAEPHECQASAALREALTIWGGHAEEAEEWDAIRRFRKALAAPPWEPAP
jgi:hypothetical protein